jgi:hypothetical protein
MDVRLRRLHLERVAELSTLRRLCCATAVPIAPEDAPITADGLRVKALVIRAARPVDRVLQPTGNGPIPAPAGMQL